MIKTSQTLSWQAISAAALFALVAAPQICAARDLVNEIAAAEDGYTRAVIGRDIDALGKTLSEDLVYVHASGLAEDKRQYLKSTLDAGFRVIGARVIQRQITLTGKIGVSIGTIGYDVGKGENAARYLAVYRKERGAWLLLRWQNTKLSLPARNN
jgi:ketosteroid isomerase-like protein